MAETDDPTLRVQQLFVRHQGQLKAFVLALWPDFARADDVLQEVFLTVTAKAAEFEPDDEFPGLGSVDRAASNCSRRAATRTFARSMPTC